MAVGYGGYSGTNVNQPGIMQGTSLSAPIPMGQPSYTPNAQGTLTPNVTPQQLAGSFSGGGVPFGGQQTDPTLASLQSLFQAGVMGPEQSLANQQMGTLQDQMALIGANRDFSSQQANQEAGYSLQNIGLQSQQLGIQQGALSRQMALLPQQYGIQTGQFDITQAQDVAGAAQQRRGLDSSATASGAFTSTGANQGRGDIQQNLDFALQSLGLQRQGAALNFQEQQAQQQDSQKQLGIQAQQLGISTDEVKSRLQNSLNQLGISSQVSVDDVLSQMNSVQQGEITPLASLFGDIYNLSGLTVPATQASGTGGTYTNMG